MLPDLMINNAIWLVMTVISFIGGQIYLFSKILGWGDLLDNFYRR